VGGANTIFGLDSWQSLSNMNFLSPDSRCYSFDSRANGYARGEGFGIVVLKPLCSAVADGDTIRAIIRSTGSNQDGRTPGITQPSGESQEALIRATYKKAGLDLNLTRYFEAHGTGTLLGDPTECAAMASVFSPSRQDESPLFVGAVKSNIGHLEGASGVAGLVKTILVLEKGVIPPNANFDKLNPRINAKAAHLAFPSSPLPWPATGLRRASVNSFGFGGTNSHVVLDDVYHYLQARGLKANHCTIPLPLPLGDPEKPPLASSDSEANESPQDVPSPKVLILSTHDDAGITRQAQVYASYFRELSERGLLTEYYMMSLAHTLNHQRTQFPWRAFAVCSTPRDLEQLDTFLSEPIQATRKLGICMIFTGQGSQYAGMGRQLLHYVPFRNTLLDADSALSSLGCRWSLLHELGKPDHESRVDLPEFSQPLCTALQIAIVNLLRSLSILPSVVIGHSSGEVAAAYAAGALSLASAMKVAYFRGLAAGRLIQQGRRQGAMLAVGIGTDKIDLYLHELPTLSIACHNGPRSLTISGDAAEIDILSSQMDRDNIFNRALKVGLAYHSRHMQEAAEFYLNCLGALEPGSTEGQPPRMISSVHVKDIDTVELNRPQYWADNLTHPVKFQQAVSLLMSSSGSSKRKLRSAGAQKPLICDILEVGPHATFQGPVKDILDLAQMPNYVRYTSILHRKKPAISSALSAIGRLYCFGYPVNLDRVNRHVGIEKSPPRTLSDLPEYQFNHSRTYWSESRISKNYRKRQTTRLELLGTPVSDWNSCQPRWRNFIRLSEMPWVEDHKVNGQIVYPATGMLVMAVEAVKQIASHPVEGFFIKEAVLSKALIIPEASEGIEVQTHLRRLYSTASRNPSSFEFACYSFGDEDWHEHCRGVVSVDYKQPVSDVDGGKERFQRNLAFRDRFSAAVDRCTTAVERVHMYEFLQSHIHLTYGPGFQRLDALKRSDDLEAIAEVDVFDVISSNPGSDIQSHVAHPATLDATAQLVYVALTRGGERSIPTTVPTRIENLWLSSRNANCGDTRSRLLVYTKSAFQGLRGTDSSVFAISQDTQELVLSIGSLQTTHLTDDLTSNDIVTAPRSVCFGLNWKPDIELMDNEQIRSYCQKSWKEESSEVQFYADLALLTYSYIVKAQEALNQTCRDERSTHIKKYLDWIDWQIGRCQDGAGPYAKHTWDSLVKDSVYTIRLAERLKKTNARGKFFVRLGENLTDILEGRADPLEIMFNQGLADDFYAEFFECVSCTMHVQIYVDLLAHKNPAMNVIEIGGGTGGFTAHILGPLSAGHQERYEQYMFTDISPSFFERVRETWKTQLHRMKFQALNIESSLDSQGFNCGGYDLVIAGSVSHLADVRSFEEPI
jgi:acyl transferase domain-containing protein